LLVRLDWFFASVPWITSYPGSMVTTLSRDVSDHHPCLISMTIDIPKSKVFQFENYWLLHEDFLLVMHHGWNLHILPQDRAKKLMTKFKNLRKVLRSWYTSISNLATNIASIKLMIGFLDTLEEF
jgi:hypothetical protein